MKNDEGYMPCPFCGDIDVTLVTKFSGNCRHKTPLYIAFAKCSLCGASSKAYAYDRDDIDEMIEAYNGTILAWNRRTLIKTDQDKEQFRNE